MSAINEALIRDVVADVLSRLGKTGSDGTASVRAPAKENCGCSGNGRVSGGSIRSGKLGVFQDANEACAAAHEGFLKLTQKGVAGRAKVVEIVKTMADANRRSGDGLNWRKRRSAGWTTKSKS